MLSLVVSMTSAFPFAEIVEILKGFPDMTWEPAVPEHLVGKTHEDLKAMLMHVPKLPQTVEKVRYVGAAPASVDWPKANPGCVNVIRDQA